AQAYVRRRKGAAVFFGRFTTALRVLVPGLAGMSDVHYPTFLAFNVAGGVLWGTLFALLGYLAGANYRSVERLAGRLGLALLALVVVVFLASRVYRSMRGGSAGSRLASARPVAWVGRRFPRQVAWGRRRLDPSSPTGWWLTFTVAAAALAAWVFGGITQDVVAHEELALRDPHVTAWVVAHRTPWLTGIMRVVTWLGSTAVIVPVAVVVGLWFLRRARRWQPLALFAAAIGGALVLYDVVKGLVGRPRPPSSIWIGHFTGSAFPSGHATQTVAFAAVLAFVLAR